ncbi:MAG: hypothetical protein HDT37_00400 [Clostridiales bacterium]|nr:hypothetical protein [Clostridiales bacterium]
MLAPDDLDAVTGTLRSVYAEMRHADRLVTTGGSFRVYDIGEKTTWVTSLRTRVALLAKDAEAWLDDKPAVASLPLSGFISYRNAFSAAAATLQGDTSKDTKVQALDRLGVAARDCMQDAQKARFQFERWTSGALTHLDDMDESIKDAWANLGRTEKKIVELSERIVAVQDGLNALTGVVAPDQLSSQTISDLAKILSNSASMVYSVAIAGLPVPYLSVLSTFFTVGKLFYTIFATDAKIHKQLKELEGCRLDLDEAQLALAQTKAALSSLYNLKQLLSGQRSSLVEIETFWQEELRNITTVRDKFVLAPYISPDDPELRQLPVAQAVWDALKGNAQGLLSNLVQGTHGKTVISITI